MTTLEQIKNDYAIQQGFANWYELITYCNEKYLDHYITEVMKIYAMECLKLASESEFTFSKRESLDSDWIVYVKKESIINENNIIK